MHKKKHVLFPILASFHGWEGKKTTLATCISNDMCSLQGHLALGNKTACKNILFYFPIVICLRDFFFFLSLCSCQDWQASGCYKVTWSSCLNNHDWNPGYFKAHYWLREPPPRRNSSVWTLTDSVREVVPFPQTLRPCPVPPAVLQPCSCHPHLRVLVVLLKRFLLLMWKSYL